MLRSVLLSNFLILLASHFALGATWKVGQTGVVFLPLSPGGSDGKSTMWEAWVRSLGQEDPLEKEMATHSSTIAWKIPWMEELGGLQSRGSA